MSAVRLFFALWPDDATRRRLHKLCRPALKRCGGRPVPARNYHVTLAFLGNVAADLVPAIRDAAARVEPVRLELKLDRFGHFPRARVAWFGPAETPPELAALARQLWEVLTPLGLEADRRPFRAHVTIARKIVRAPEPDCAQPLSWPVQGFALIRSVTAPEGSRYVVDQGFPEGSSNEP